MPTIDEIMIEPPSGDAPVDPMSWYDAPGPFEMEIGSGKGGYLLHRARSNPHVRLLGIEWANKWCRYSADRVVRWNLSNVRVMRADARRFVLKNLPRNCLSALHLYHPDPWPKRRHHKRRLIQPDFTDAVARALRTDGRWRIQTDHEEYYLHIQEVLAACSALEEIPVETPFNLVEQDWPGTNYEVKYLREGRRIYRAVYARSRLIDDLQHRRCDHEFKS